MIDIVWVIWHYFEFIKKVYPLSSYDLEAFILHESVSSPIWTLVWKEESASLYNRLEKIRKTVNADRLVGVVQKDWPRNKRQCGIHTGSDSVLIKEMFTTSCPKVVSTHEIGHTFCLCEEYKADSCVKSRPECKNINPNAPGVNPEENEDDIAEIINNGGRESDAYPGKRCMMGGGNWICPNCYIHLFKEFIGEPKSTSGMSSQSLTEIQTSQSPTEVLFVSGMVWKNGSVEFYELSRMKDQIPDQITPGNYAIECLDADGKVLSETPFDVSFYTEYDEVNVTGFAFTIPYQSRTKKVVVKYKEELKDEFVLSANSPTVSVISPNGGESFSGSFTVTWTASDPDGDELSYTLLYSNNEGADWSILAMDINETSHAVNTSMLGGGTKCMVKVIASDGANTAEDISNGCFTVETKNPIATISSPENNSEFMEWDRIEFSGFGYDFDDGILPDESLAWTSSIDGVIGHGSSFSNTSLSTGEHLITLTARDSEGETANATIMINVLSRKPTPIFNFTPSKIFVNQRVTFNASLSYDLDGNITNYEWEFGDGTNGTGEIITHSYSLAGVYMVNLTVTDDDGATNSTSKTITVSPLVTGFDTGTPSNPYPSIAGTHTGTITPNRTITVNKLYTYPCAGTGGHTESIELYDENGNLIASGNWNGYQQGDWHNITFDNPVVLLPNETYNYTIRTGSYPQIHHNTSLLTPNGWINCSEFVDANGKVYYDWIPAIRLFSEEGG